MMVLVYAGKTEDNCQMFDQGRTGSGLMRHNRADYHGEPGRVEEGIEGVRAGTVFVRRKVLSIASVYFTCITTPEIFMKLMCQMPRRESSEQ